MILAKEKIYFKCIYKSTIKTVDTDRVKVSKETEIYKNVSSKISEKEKISNQIEGNLFNNKSTYTHTHTIY